MNKISGIYEIRSRIKPERIYIGSAVNIHKRWGSHLNELEKNKHKNGRLQNHFNKYGKDDLIYSILMGCDKDCLLTAEQYFLDIYKPYFNIQQHTTHTNLGRKFSDEVKEKLSLSHMGIKYSEESKSKRSQSLRGRIPWNVGVPCSKECKAKQSAKLKGKTWDEIYGKEGARKRMESIKNKWALKKQNKAA